MADIVPFLQAIFNSDKDLDKQVRDMGMDPSTRAVIDSLSHRLTTLQNQSSDVLATTDVKNQVLGIAAKQVVEQKKLQALISHYASKYKIDMKNYTPPEDNSATDTTNTTQQ